MSRFPLLALLLAVALLGLACSGGNSNPVTPFDQTNLAAGNPDNHVAWGVFDVKFDLESGSAELIWNRAAQNHINVTGAITPPNCFTCVDITGTSYDAGAMKFYLQVAFTNPTPIIGYDVRAVIQNPGGSKYLLNPDGMTTVWGSPMQFKAININDGRAFAGYGVHGRTFEFYFPPGENFKTITYIVDASKPSNVDEPLIEEGACDAIVNNGFATTNVRARIFDHQGDLNPATAMVDLMSLGGSPQAPLFDDGAHNDGTAGDGVFGSNSFSTTAAVNVYMLNVYAIDNSGHMGWGQVAASVQKTSGGNNEDPIIDSFEADRTTANGAKNEKIKITVSAHDPNGDPLGYQFEASSGTFSGQNGGEAFWKPSSSNFGPQTITVTVLDDKGAADTAEGNLWSTNLSIINGSTNGKIPPANLQCVKPEGVTLDMDSDFYQQVLYINFWATWCGYCVQEMPDLTAVWNKYKSNPGYNHVYINLQESNSTALNFINSNNFAGSHWAMDPSGSYFNVANDFNQNSGGIPQHVLFDRDGNARWSHVGGLIYGTAELEAAIDQLL